MKRRILFIVNPISGHHNKKAFPKKVLSCLDHSRYTDEITFTEYAGHAASLSQQAVNDGFDIIVAVGGDGTINEVSRAIIGTDVTMAIVPFGSGNGLARCLRLPLFQERAIAQINEFSTLRMDTALVNDCPFLSIAGVGLDAQTAYDFSKDPKRGFITYAKYALSNYLYREPVKYKMCFDDQMTIECSPLLITFANSNQFGYNAVIAPKSSLADGLLDACILNRPPVPVSLHVANQLLLGQIDRSRYFTETKFQKVVVERPAEDVVNIDGEPIMFPSRLEIKVVPQSLTMICGTKNLK